MFDYNVNHIFDNNDSCRRQWKFPLICYNKLRHHCLLNCHVNSSLSPGIFMVPVDGALGCHKWLLLSFIPTLLYTMKHELVFSLHLNSLRPSDAYMRQQSSQHWFRQWIVAWSAPSHYQNQCSDIVNWSLRNKLQWTFNHNSHIFIQDNAFENVVWKITAILPRSQCIKGTTHC